MTPRPDHRRPAAAFAVLFLVAMALLGNGLRAHAAVGTWVAAGDPVLPRLVQTLASPAGARPTPATATAVVGPRHGSPLAVGSRARHAARATTRRAARRDVHPVRRTPAARHGSTPATATGPARRARGHAPAAVRSVPGRALGHARRPGGRAAGRAGHVRSGHAVGADGRPGHGHHGSGR